MESIREVRKAVIPAAGLGRRFLPYTVHQPKEMLPLLNRPVIQYVVKEAIDSGIRDIRIITSEGKGVMQEHFGFGIRARYFKDLAKSAKKYDELNELEELEEIHANAKFSYSIQPEQNGLGDAVLHAKNFVGDEPFALLLGDDVTFSKREPCTKTLCRLYGNTGKSVVAVKRVSADEVSSYGIVAVDPEPNYSTYRVRGLVEKPMPKDAPSDLAIYGRYVLTPGIFSSLERTKHGKNGELQLTDAMHDLLNTEDILAHEFDGKRFDLGTPDGWLAANLELAAESSTRYPKTMGVVESCLRSKGFIKQTRSRK